MCYGFFRLALPLNCNARALSGCVLADVTFPLISDSEKKIYEEIEKTKKKELISKQDKW